MQHPERGSDGPVGAVYEPAHRCLHFETSPPEVVYEGKNAMFGRIHKIRPSARTSWPSSFASLHRRCLSMAQFFLDLGYVYGTFKDEVHEVRTQRPYRAGAFYFTAGTGRYRVHERVAGAKWPPGRVRNTARTRGDDVNASPRQ